MNKASRIASKIAPKKGWEGASLQRVPLHAFAPHGRAGLSHVLTRPSEFLIANGLQPAGSRPVLFRQAGQAGKLCAGKRRSGRLAGCLAGSVLRSEDKARTRTRVE